MRVADLLSSDAGCEVYPVDQQAAVDPQGGKGQWQGGGMPTARCKGLTLELRIILFGSLSVSKLKGRRLFSYQEVNLIT